MIGKKSTPESRKERSEKVLAKHKVMINPHLPCIESEDEAKIKSPEEIVKRAVTAFITAQIAIDICNNDRVSESVGFFAHILEGFGLTGELTDDEKRYFDLSKHGEITQDDANQMQWRLEMCIPLFWACGFWKRLDYPNEITDTTKLIALISSCGNFNELMSLVKIRDPKAILDEADLIFRMDWACVEARLKGDPRIMGDLFSDVVVERHKGLNWLIGAFDAEDWDNVRAHT